MRGLAERQVVVDGVAVNACVAGDGPSIVLVHGLAGSWRYWYATVEALRDRFRLVAVDVPGFGHSEVAADPFSLDRAGDLLLAAWEELGASQPVLVGHSLGGALATSLAADHPGRISRLVLVSPAGFGLRPAMRAAALLAPLWRLTTVGVGRHELAWVQRPRLRRRLFAGLVGDPRQLSAYDALVMLRGGARARQFPSSTRAIVRADLREAANRIGVPALVVWGARDRIVPSREALTVARSLPHAELRILDDVGHMPMLEAKERFARLLASFAGAAA